MGAACTGSCATAGDKSEEANDDERIKAVVVVDGDLSTAYEGCSNDYSWQIDVENIESCASSMSLDESARGDIDATRLNDALSATKSCQLHLASSIIREQRALSKTKRSIAAIMGPSFSELDEVNGRIERVQRFLKTCAPGPGKEWRRFDLELSTLWRCWDGGTLKLILQWDAPGSLSQHIASVRAVECAEELWEGACWDMWSQHVGGVSLVRWLDKDSFTGRKREVLFERILCDCFDSDLPFWVLLERCPDVDDGFQGKWGPFDVEPCPKGYTRQPGDGGRLIEPIDDTHCRCTISYSIQVPALLRWIVTDAILKWGTTLGGKYTMKSWIKIIEGWESSKYSEYMKKHADFYETVKQRTAAFLAKKSRA
eukprot:TRINITY_DN26713_c0_g2_i1.p1 TRINITY_DN26713_c0_g2~~TRINITY_DN26713_c0_g2_i1.p1  ORF type:complete len:370 (+),score=42.72 TRINITY_DN26713_c0_g2_i1:57-1166(+)